MNFVWVQQWVALPVISEEPMGDAPPNPSGFEGHPQDGGKPNAGQQSHGSAGPGQGEGAQPFYSQFSGIPQQQRADASRSQPGMAPYNTVPAQSHGDPSFNMSHLANALPEYSTSQAQAQRGQTMSAAPFRGQQYPSGSHFSGSYGPGQFPGGLSLDQSLGAGSAQIPRPGALGVAASPYSPYGQQLPQYYYPNSPFSPQNQPQSFFPGGGQAIPSYDRRPSMGQMQAMQGSFPGSAIQPQGSGRVLPGSGGYAEQCAPAEGELYSYEATQRSRPLTPCRSRRPEANVSKQHDFNSSRAASKAEAVWSRALGGKLTPWHHCSGPEGSLRSRGNQGYRELVLDIEEQLCLRELSNRSLVCSGYATFPRFPISRRSTGVQAPARLSSLPQRCCSIFPQS